MEYGFSSSTAKKLIEQESKETVNNALKAVNLQIEKDNVKNLKAMLRTAIKDHFRIGILKYI